MNVLCVYLDKDEISTIAYGTRGLPLALHLYNEYKDQNPVIISSPSKESVAFPGGAVFTILFRSPITGRISLSYSNLAPGYSLYRMGYDAVVLIGRSRKLSYISIYPDNAEKIPCESLRGASYRSFSECARRNPNDAVLSTGCAADNGIIFSTVISDDRTIESDGLGYALAVKNIKGMVLKGYSRQDEISKDKAVAATKRRIESNPELRRVRKHGSASFIDNGLRLGWLPVSSYSRRFDPRCYALDGIAFTEKYGKFPESCQDCFLACGRRDSSNSVLPGYQECMMFGSNLGFYSPEDVRKIADAARAAGTDVWHTGAILSYLAGNESDYSMPCLKGKSADEHARAISQLCCSLAGHEVLSKGLESLPGCLQTKEHTPYRVDPRGSYPMAIMTAIGLPLMLPVSLFLAERGIPAESAPVFALYESSLMLALISRGLVPLTELPASFGSVPKGLYGSRRAMRYAFRHLRLYGIDSRTLLREGIELLESLSVPPFGIDERFIMDPDSSLDSSTVPYLRLIQGFEEEKERLLRWLKSRSEKRTRPSSEKSTAVGPSEERGREGDPGLTE